MGYRAAVLHSRYAADYNYLFTANRFPQPTNWKLWLIDLRFSIEGFTGPGKLLAAAAVAVLCLSFFKPLRILWSNALFVASLLVLAGVALFVFWHSYQAPRYYLFAPIPLAILVSQGTAVLLPRTRPPLRWIAALPLAAILILNGARTLRFIAHPEYTFLHAAQALTRFIDQRPDTRRLLLSEAGDQITLFTGLPAICDDFGTAPLPDELNALQPGWFATWDYVDPAVLDQLHTRYHLQRAGVFPLMDDPRRSALVLYRLVPLQGPERGLSIKPPGLIMYHRPRP